MSRRVRERRPLGRALDTASKIGARCNVPLLLLGENPPLTGSTSLGALPFAPAPSDRSAYFSKYVR